MMKHLKIYRFANGVMALMLLIAMSCSSSNGSKGTDVGASEDNSTISENSQSADQSLDSELEEDPGHDPLASDSGNDSAAVAEAPSATPQDIPEADVAPVPSKKKSVSHSAGQSTMEVQGAGAVSVKSLEFKGNQSGGTIVVQTSGPANFTTRKNADKNQFVLELTNAELPAKFKRPFITKEFASPIGSFTAYQVNGTNTVRIVAQLKESTDLTVKQEGNALLVLPGSSPTGEQLGKSESESEADEATDLGISETGDTKYSNDSSKKTGSDRALSGSLDNFMSGDLKFYGKPISIEFLDGDIRDILNFIADESGLNMIVGEDVKGTISIKLRQVPWDQALVLVLQAKKLGYIRQGRVLRVAPLEALQKEAESTRMTMEAQKNLAPLKTKIIKLNYTSAKQIQTSLGGAAGSSTSRNGFLSPRGSAISDDRTNSVIVTDIDENLTKIEELLRRLDRPTPQVLIESKIVETKETFGRNLGINWSSIANGFRFGAQPKVDTPTIGQNMASSVSAQILYPDAGDFSTFIAASETQGKTKTLASPRIVTVSGVKAKFNQDFTYFYIDSSTNIVSTATTTAGTSAPTTTVSKKKETISLIDFGITPLVTNDNRVKMDIELTRQFADTEAADGTRNTNTRKASSTLLVSSGQTAVIAGNYLVDEGTQEDRIPILGSIPIVGNLFKTQTKSEDKTELAIFITPTILENQ